MSKFLRFVSVCLFLAPIASHAINNFSLRCQIRPWTEKQKIDPFFPTNEIASFLVENNNLVMTDLHADIGRKTPMPWSSSNENAHIFSEGPNSIILNRSTLDLEIYLSSKLDMSFKCRQTDYPSDLKAIQDLWNKWKAKNPQRL